MNQYCAYFFILFLNNSLFFQTQQPCILLSYYSIKSKRKKFFRSNRNHQSSVNIYIYIYNVCNTHSICNIYNVYNIYVINVTYYIFNIYDIYNICVWGCVWTCVYCVCVCIYINPVLIHLSIHFFSIYL